MVLPALILVALGTDLFTVTANARFSATVDLSREAVRGYLDDIGLFQRNMPGVTAFERLADGRFSYQTERDVPLSGTMRTDFLLTRSVAGDSVTVYESADPDTRNYMFCRILIRPLGERRTAVEITFHVRLKRESATDIHWLAPVLGSDFLSEKMTDDLQEMLETFVRLSNSELEARLSTQAAYQRP